MYYVDPVCGKKFRRKEGYAILKRGDDVYHLCCRECKEAFQENPSQYLHKDASVEQDAEE